MTMPWPSQVVTYEKRIPSFQLRNAATGNLFACMGYRRATTPSSTADRFRCRLVSVPAPYMHVHVRLSQPLNGKAVYIVCTDRQTGARAVCLLLWAAWQSCRRLSSEAVMDFLTVQSVSGSILLFLLCRFNTPFVANDCLRQSFIWLPSDVACPTESSRCDHCFSATRQTKEPMFSVEAR